MYDEFVPTIGVIVVYSPVGLALVTPISALKKSLSVIIATLLVVDCCDYLSFVVLRKRCTRATQGNPRKENPRLLASL